MRRDQKAAQKKKAREKARVTARASSALPTIAKMATMPFGPCWLTRSWRSTALPPHLVSAIVTRDNDGIFAAHVMLIDRTCLGVKDAFTVGPLTERELFDLAKRVGESHPDGIEPASLEDTRSVVFAALAYAQRLGFRPSPDLDLRLLGPAPEELRPTPLANQRRPHYYPGPNDDAPRVIAALERAVGVGGFDVVGEEAAPPRREDEL